jgi:hypothetical protein
MKVRRCAGCGKFFPYEDKPRYVRRHLGAHSGEVSIFCTEECEERSRLRSYGSMYIDEIRLDESS